jgi:Hypothetical glycosyl hydrolase family 15
MKVLLMVLLALGTVGSGVAVSEPAAPSALAERHVSGRVAPPAGLPLPPPVPDRIGRAQIFSYRIKDRQDLARKRDIVWGDDGEKIQGLYSIKYMMTDRDPDRGHDVTWYKAHHPDWVVYKNDRETPAHEFKYDWGYNTPVDFNNPAVREYLFAVNVKPDIASHRFEAIGVDNVECRNEWHRAGVWGPHGWHQKYRGGEEKVDPAFARDVAAWMGWLGARVHAAGMALVANHYPHLDDEGGYRRVAAKLDIILDEHGYTRDGKAMLTGDQWLRYISLFAELARTKPIIVVDQLARDRSRVTPAVRNWALANYLLMKGDRTYLAWPMEGAYGGLDEYPELYLPIGRPLGDFVRDGRVFRRRFEKALAIVNPERDVAATCNIGPGRWRDLAGTQHAGVVSLPPASGLVLVPDGQP